MPRSLIASDTFDASIDANWTQGEGDTNNLAWATGGFVQPAATSSLGRIRRNTGTYSNDQYCKLTINSLTNTDARSIGAVARAQASASDESAYIASWEATSEYGRSKYEIQELNSTNTNTVLTGSGTPAAAAANDTVSIEVEGTTIRMFTEESGGAETQRISTTDATIASGWPAIQMYSESSATVCRITAWEAGDVVAVATLSSPTPSGTLGTPTSATIGATTNITSGTLYTVVDDTAALLVAITATQIKAGQNNLGAAADFSGNNAVSTTTPSIAIAGLTAATTYYYATVQNTTGGDSNIVTGSFTTSSGVVIAFRRSLLGAGA